jgi:hypothetical protein
MLRRRNFKQNLLINPHAHVGMSVEEHYGLNLMPRTKPLCGGLDPPLSKRFSCFLYQFSLISRYQRTFRMHPERTLNVSVRVWCSKFERKHNDRIAKKNDQGHAVAELFARNAKELSQFSDRFG